MPTVDKAGPLEAARERLARLARRLEDALAHAADCEADEQRLSREDGPTLELADARGRAATLHALADDLHAKLEDARGELGELEGAQAREHTLSQMVKQAKQAERSRAALAASLTEANEALKPLMAEAVQHHDSWSRSRGLFVDLGRPLSRGFGRNIRSPSIQPGDDEDLQRVLDELAAKGAPLEAVLSELDDWQKTLLDHPSEPLPTPEPYGAFILGAFELARGGRHG